MLAPHVKLDQDAPTASYRHSFKSGHRHRLLNNTQRRRHVCELRQTLLSTCRKETTKQFSTIVLRTGDGIESESVTRTKASTRRCCALFRNHHVCFSLSAGSNTHEPVSSSVHTASPRNIEHSTNLASSMWGTGVWPDSRTLLSDTFPSRSRLDKRTTNTQRTGTS